MNIFDAYDLEKPVDNYLGQSVDSLPWESISDYLMFLTLKNGGCSKMNSGEIAVRWGQRWSTEDPRKILVEVGGYDLTTGSRHQIFEGNSEPEVKAAIIAFLEKERQAQLSKDSNDEF